MPRVDVDVAHSTTFIAIRYGRSSRVCLAIQARDRVTDSQLVYFFCCRLPRQAVLDIESDWVYSFGVVLGCDMNVNVFVLSESFPQNLRIPCSSLPTKNCCNTKFLTSAPSER